MFGKNKKSAPAGAETKKAQKKLAWVNNLRQGRTISVDFFKSNGWLLGIIVVAVVGLIGLRYQT